MAVMGSCHTVSGRLEVIGRASQGYESVAIQGVQEVICRGHSPRAAGAALQARAVCIGAFIGEEHSVVGPRRLARPRHRPPLKLISETVCWGHGTGAGEAGDAVDVIGLEGFGQVHRWQDSGEAACLLPLLVYHHCRRFPLAFLEIVSALAKCERDGQRWAEAYSEALIDYRARVR
jgi:hypothetical protein